MKTRGRPVPLINDGEYTYPFAETNARGNRIIPISPPRYEETSGGCSNARITSPNDWDLGALTNFILQYLFRIDEEIGHVRFICFSRRVTSLEDIIHGV